MRLNTEQMWYSCDMYEKVRFAKRNLMTMKPKDEQIDPSTMPGVMGFYDVKHMQGFFTMHDDIKYAHFIGSNEILDWFYNFAFPFATTPYKSQEVNQKIKVHGGFRKSYALVRDIIHKELQHHEKVVITGHSLGGAIATLAAIDIQYNYPDKDIGCFTTGSPRVGNRLFCNSFNRRLPDMVRCVLGNDLISGVPFQMLGFQHVGDLLLLGKDRRLGLSIKDHSIKLYKRELELIKGE